MMRANITINLPSPRNFILQRLARAARTSAMRLQRTLPLLLDPRWTVVNAQILSFHSGLGEPFGE
jgi:hypothetical protein